MDEIYSTTPNTDYIDLDCMLGKLDLKSRVCIYYSYVKGFTNKEISTMFEIPITTVKSRKSIGLRELRKMYKTK